MFSFQCLLCCDLLFISTRSFAVLGCTSTVAHRNLEYRPSEMLSAVEKKQLSLKVACFQFPWTTSSALLLFLLYVLFLSISVSLSSCLLFLGTAVLGWVSDLFLRCWDLTVYKLCLFSFWLISEIIWGDPFGTANWTMMEIVLAFTASDALAF